MKESAPSRIVNVSSLAHKFAAENDLNDLSLNNNYSSKHAYAVSKVCNVLFNRELADRLAGSGKAA